MYTHLLVLQGYVVIKHVKELFECSQRASRGQTGCGS